MKLELVTGGTGSGKSGYIENKIEECIKDGLRAVVIVPERFSHMEERTLCERFGGLGINGVEVTTFSKLARRLKDRGEYLTPSGRQMLILKAAQKNEDAGDGIFKSSAVHSGFTEQLGSAIGEFKRCMVTPETLLQFRAGGYLERKMNALGAIYSSYNELLGEGFADPDEDMELLGKRIEEDGGFSDARIFIDGFSDFLPSHYCVISALLKWADEMYITLGITDAAQRSPDGIFEPVARCAIKLIRTAAERGVPVEKKHFSGEGAHIISPDLRYFIRNYDEYDPDSGERPPCENISITKLFDRHAEVERLAGRIMYEVREKGLRFRDIGVIAGSLDSYAHIIDAVFTDCGIPYFTDRKLTVSEHPVIRLVLSVFRVINENWSFGAVFEYLRSGFIYQKTAYGLKRLDQHDVDRLENYVKKHGIRGKKAWLSEEAWQPKKAGIFDEVMGVKNKEEPAEGADRLRRELMQPFERLIGAISGRRRVSELAAGLFEFLNDINLYDGLLWEQKCLEEQNLLDDAARLGEIWNALIETLDQAVLTMGSEYMSRERFALMLEAGLSQATVDAVPSGADRVSVGAADSSRPVRVRTLFVIGALSGELPPEGGEQGILNDSDRLILEQQGIELLPSAGKRSALSEFQLYSALSAACERLYISFPGETGEKSVVCSLAEELLSMFPDLEITQPDEKEQWENLFASPKRTYYRMLSRLASGASDEERSFWMQTVQRREEEAVQRFNRKAGDNSDFSIFNNCRTEHEDILTRAQRYSTAHAHISPETAFALYEGRPFSITSLQMYNKCPFSFFVRYGLGVKEQEEYKLRSYDLGELVHWAVCQFCNRVQGEADSLEAVRRCWTGLDKKASDGIIAGLCADIVETTKKANPDFGAERLEYICSRAQKTLTEAVDMIRESLIAGGFSACGFEKKFEINIEYGTESIPVQGVIDRLDMAEEADGVLLRVIDYKTGAQQFSVAGICSKTDLQLMIYAIAAQKLYEAGALPYASAPHARVGAALYGRMREELTKAEIGSGGTKQQRILDGIVVTGGEPKEASCEELALHDGALSEGGVKSSYLSLKTNNDGTLRASGSVISAEKFKRLTDYAAKAACETKAEVFAGEAAAYPVQKNNARPCSYCAYADICLHDDARDGVRKQVTSEDKAWEIIENGGECTNE